MTNPLVVPVPSVWPADHRCTSPGCGHARGLHAEPLVQDGRCTVVDPAACLCLGWDPMTDDEWREVYAQRRPPDAIIAEAIERGRRPS